MLVYESGPVYSSIVVDPKGLLSESFYAEKIDSYTRGFTCNTTSLKSKRPQPKELDIPQTILGKFIFVPTQF